MSRKKRTFILLELFIAVALVAFFSLPLVHGQRFYVREQKKRLLNLEKERKAEELFYKICEKLIKTHNLHEIPYREYKNAIFTFEDNLVSFDFGKLGKENLYWHYHLYSNVKKEKSCRKLHFKICFLDDPQAKCSTPHKFGEANYGFTLTISKMPKQ